MAKNKMKTHGSTTKRVKVRPGGTIKISAAGTRHNTGKKSASSSRTKRKGATLSNSDYKRIKTLI